MDPRWRSAFNAGYDDDLFAAYAVDLEDRVGRPIGFRLAETPVFVPSSFRRACESAGRAVLAACSEGDALRTNLAVLKRFTKFEPVDAIAVRRRIAGRLLQAEKYIL